MCMESQVNLSNANCVRIYNQALKNDDHLKAAYGLVSTLLTYPDLRGNVDVLEAIGALIREGMLRQRVLANK